MHRQRTRLAARVPARAQPVLRAVERRGIAATYELHDRLLSNREARRRFAEQPSALDDVQQRVVDAVKAEGYATVALDDLVRDDSLRAAIEEQGAAFIAETERGLQEERHGSNGELRRGAGKDFLVRAHSFAGDRLDLGHAWFRACLSPAMLGVANAYLHMWAKLSYVDLWYTIQQDATAERKASQLWHFDFDDKHLLKAFLYLRDVDQGTGPFEYVAGSQPGGPYHSVRPWRPMDYGRVPEDQVKRAVPDEAVRTFTAPRNTVIFCNTSGLHRGGFAVSGPRILATATSCSPASLAALSLRNYQPDASALAGLDPAAAFAVS